MAYRFRAQLHGQRNRLRRGLLLHRKRALHHLYAGEPVVLHEEVASSCLSRIVRVEIAAVVGDVKDAGEETWMLDGKGDIGCPHATHDTGNLVAGEADFVAVREDPV